MTSKNGPSASRLHSWIAKKQLNASSRLGRLAFDLARRIAIRTGDRPIAYSIGGTSAVIPMSHALPSIRRYHTNYDEALPRLARNLQAFLKKAQFVAVDIGANVGDTALTLLAQPDTFVIAVDGNAAFIPYLRKNLAPFGSRTALVESFIGPEGKSEFSIETSRGTAHLARGNKETAVDLVSLSTAVSQAGQTEVDLIKIDTDGFDIQIIESALDYLRTSNAAIFFEFDPNFFLSVTPAGWNVFPILSGIGYRHGIAYVNTGQFHRSFSLDDAAAIEEFRTFLASSNDKTYLDIIVFKDDASFAACRAGEIAHFDACWEGMI